MARSIAVTSAPSYNEPKYLDAWAESYQPVMATEYDHSIAAVLQFLPWVQAKLWQPRLSGGGIQIRPFLFGARTPSEARIQTPDGDVTVKWNEQGSIQAMENVEVC